MTVGKKLLILLGGLTLVRLFVGGTMELSLDEGYYWQWGKNLDLSYYDHPPMVALMIAMTTLFSDAEIFVRLGPIAGGIISSLLLYRLAVNLYRDRYAGFHSVWIANLTLIFSAGALVATPDTPLIPFYLASILCFHHAARRGPAETDTPWGKWLLTGFFAGCAMLSKYTAVFFFPGGLAFLLLNRESRAWLAKPHPWAAAALSFILFAPVLVWNARNGWVSISFQAGHGLAKSQAGPLALFGEFFGFQVILYSIGIFFFLLAALAAAARRGFAENRYPFMREANLFIFSFSAPILLFFLLNSFRSRMEGNWPVLAFLPLVVQAGAMIVEWNGGKRSRLLLRGSVALAVALVAVLHVQLVDPLIPHPQRYEISRRVYGWRLLSEKIDETRKTFPAAFLISNRHQIAALLTYYTSPHLPSYLLGANNRRLTTFLPSPDVHKGKGVIYVTENERDESGMLAPLFDRMEKAEEVEITRKGELIRRFTIYRCYNYRGGLEGI